MDIKFLYGLIVQVHHCESSIYITKVSRSIAYLHYRVHTYLFPKLMKIINQYSSQGKALIMPEAMPENTCPLDMGRRSVLIVEDQVGYRELICEAIAELYAHAKIQVAKDGAEAWHLLEQHNHQDRVVTYPSLIIVDLNLPKISGLELLRRIKTDRCLQIIPVVIFSTSQDENDILKCYQAQGNCFITKPRDVDNFFEVVQSMVTFWFNLVSLPNQAA